MFPPHPHLEFFPDGLWIAAVVISLMWLAVWLLGRGKRK